MQSFTQYTPTEIVFGRGAQKEAGKLAKKWGGSRVLLVYGGERSTQQDLAGDQRRVGSRRHCL